MVNKLPKNNLKDFLQIKNSTETKAELYFYGDIVSDGWSAWINEDQYPESVRNFLKGHEGKDLDIYINSAGGAVFAGVAIYHMLKRHSGYKTVYVDGLAASIASVIALAGDKVVIPKTSMIMVHKPWIFTYGGFNAPELLKMADDLDKVEKVITNAYAENLKEGVKIEDVQELVSNETWLTGEEAAEYFRIEVTEEESKIAACASDYFKNYKNTPKNIPVQAKEKTNSEEKRTEENKKQLELAKAKLNLRRKM